MSRSRLAAEHKHRTGCTYAEAARLHGIKSAGAVAREYKRIYLGIKRVRKDVKRYVPRPKPVPVDRIKAAVDFMIAYDTTSRRAADAFGVPAQEVIDAYNARTGARRQLVG